MDDNENSSNAADPADPVDYDVEDNAVDDTIDDAAGGAGGADADDGADDAGGNGAMPDGDVDAPQAAMWTRPASTGVPSVDAAIDELARLDELPTGEHVAVYEGLHRQLQDALADLDGS